MSNEQQDPTDGTSGHDGSTDEVNEIPSSEDNANNPGNTGEQVVNASPLADRLRAVGIGKAVAAKVDVDPIKSEFDMDYENWAFTLDRANNGARDKAAFYREAGAYVGAAARVRIEGDKVYALDRLEMLAAIKAGIADVMVQWEDVPPENAMIRSCQIHGGIAMGNKEKDRAIRKILTSPAQEIHGTTSWLDRPPGWLAAEIGIPQNTITACAERSKLKFSDCLIGRDGREWKKTAVAEPDEPDEDKSDETQWAMVRYPELAPTERVKVTIAEVPSDQKAGAKIRTVTYSRTLPAPTNIMIDADGARWKMTGKNYSIRFDKKNGVVSVEAEVEIVAPPPTPPSDDDDPVPENPESDGDVDEGNESEEREVSPTELNDEQLSPSSKPDGQPSRAVGQDGSCSESVGTADGMMRSAANADESLSPIPRKRTQSQSRSSKRRKTRRQPKKCRYCYRRIPVKDALTHREECRLKKAADKSFQTGIDAAVADYQAESTRATP